MKILILLLLTPVLGAAYIVGLVYAAVMDGFGSGRDTFNLWGAELVEKYKK